jgi:F-type H+-transporting ATPase subunit b
MPPGHPPLSPEMKERFEREMRRRQAGGRQPGQPGAMPGMPGALPGAPGAPKTPQAKPRYPRDEHGHCVGQGADDRPKDINLVHGLLGVNNDKVVAEPRPKGSGEWWKWRLTPTLYRYENKDDVCDPKNQPVPLLANIVNLAALLFLLTRFGKKPLAAALEKRKRDITAEVERARAIFKSARARLERHDYDIDHLDDALGAMREQYAAEGDVEEKRVVSEMLEAHQRLLSDAEFRVSQESKQARDELSREALDGALTAAEELLKTSVTSADHDRLCEDFLGELKQSLAALPSGAQGEGRS